MKKILIAEDEKPMAKALELKLSHAGFKVKSVLNGEEAIIALEKDKFDVILLDLVMPKKDGFEVLEDLKAKNVKTPIIVLSNLSQDEDIDRAKSLGADDFFIKSDTPIADVIGLVEKALKH